MSLFQKRCPPSSGISEYYKEDETVWIRFLSIILLLSQISAGSGCNSLFFYPMKEHRKNPHVDRLSPEDIFFRSSDGIRLHGWFIRPAEKARGALLLFHGNAENISTHVNSVVWLVEAGYQVFLFDYRGYGRSEGQPTMAGIHRDASAAVGTIFRIAGVRKDRVILFGQSLGGAVAVYSLVNSPFRDRVRALVIDSSFSSYRKVAREKIGRFILTWPLQYPLGFLVTDRYSPDRWIHRVSPVPLLIVHGSSDRVVPEKHGKLLFQKAREPKQFFEVQGAGHIQAFATEEARKRLLSFLASLPVYDECRSRKRRSAENSGCRGE